MIWKAKKTASGMWHKQETFFKQSEKNLPECEEVIKQDKKGTLKTDETKVKELVTFFTQEKLSSP